MKQDPSNVHVIPGGHDGQSLGANGRAPGTSGYLERNPWAHTLLGIFMADAVWFAVPELMGGPVLPHWVGVLLAILNLPVLMLAGFQLRLSNTASAGFAQYVLFLAAAAFVVTELMGGPVLPHWVGVLLAILNLPVLVLAGFQLRLSNRASAGFAQYVLFLAAAAFAVVFSLQVFGFLH